MKRIKGFVKENIKVFIAFVAGAVLFGGGVYAATVAANTVSYSNTSSGIAATNVQGAIDELYEKASSKIVSAYTYNESSCVTGGETTCVKSTCYKTKTSGSCSVGTIIDYKVDATTVVRFHVMKDNGTTMTMQSQKAIVKNTAWNHSATKSNYVGLGPDTVLTELENQTKGWSNVNNQTYTLGTTSFSGLGAYTACDNSLSCTSNLYTMASRTAKARLITVQEASNAQLGKCSNSTNGTNCAKWMVDDEEVTYNWTMNTSTETSSSGMSSASAWVVQNESGGRLLMAGCPTTGVPNCMYNNGHTYNRGAKAVVEVTK